MEKTVLEQKETYVDSVHRWGRIWGLTLLVLIVAYPIAVSLIFHAQVNWPAFIKGFIAIGPMYWAVGIVEIFTYVPMLGAGGSYLSFVTGNISNLKLPCALDAMERAGVKSNSEEGEVISTIAIAVSSIVTTLISGRGAHHPADTAALLPHPSPSVLADFTRTVRRSGGGVCLQKLPPGAGPTAADAGAVHLCTRAQCVHGRYHGAGRCHFQLGSGAYPVQKGPCLSP